MFFWNLRGTRFVFLRFGTHKSGEHTVYAGRLRGLERSLRVGFDAYVRITDTGLWAATRV